MKINDCFVQILNIRKQSVKKWIFCYIVFLMCLWRRTPPLPIFGAKFQVPQMRHWCTHAILYDCFQNSKNQENEKTNENQNMMVKTFETSPWDLGLGPLLLNIWRFLYISWYNNSGVPCQMASQIACKLEWYLKALGTWGGKNRYGRDVAIPQKIKWFLSNKTH